MLNGHADELVGPERLAVEAVVLGLAGTDGRGPLAGPLAERRRKAWSGRSDLNREGHEDATLDALEGAGWLATWRLPAGPVVTLTPWCAERLNLELVERFEYVRPTEDDREAGTKKKRAVADAVAVAKWADRPPPREPGTRPRKSYAYLPRRHINTPLSDWASTEMIDPRPGPLDALIIAEEFAMMQVMSPDGEPVRGDDGMPRLERLQILGCEVPLARLRGKKARPGSA